MSALPPAPPTNDLEAADQYLVGYGKSGAVGVFLATGPLPLRRGAAVVLQTPRGLERGSVLGPATLRQARLLGAAASGALLRRATVEDEAHAERTRRADEIFETGRARARQDGLAIELLDVDLLLDGRMAILQYVGEEDRLDTLAQALESQCGVAIRLENLAAPKDEEQGGCGKPDCGREAGGCSTCSSGGGCSSCGSGKVDMRDYFGHLRTQMESKRTPLL